MGRQEGGWGGREGRREGGREGGWYKLWHPMHGIDGSTSLLDVFSIIGTGPTS